MKLIRPELKYLHSPDVFDFSTYCPEEEDNFGFLVQAIVGPQGTEGEESFDIMVVTPKWLGNKVQEIDIFLARHYLIVREYNWDRIRKFITDYIERCTAETWHEAALRLSRLGRWEFEDYRPYKAEIG